MDPVVARLRAAGCVFAEDEAAVLRATASTPAELEAPLLARRVAGEPLEHVVGWVDVAGVRVAVGPGVFVPRQRSRVLVAATLAMLPPATPGRTPVVVEACCGAAAIAVAVARARPDVEVWACDIDPAAVALARRNLGGDRVRQGDLLDALPKVLRGSVAVVVANAPYVPTAEIATMPVEAREHEPTVALDGGGDGVEVHRRLAAQVGEWLAPGGSLVVETSRAQTPLTVAALQAHGLSTSTRRDEGIDGTAVIGTAGG